MTSCVVVDLPVHKRISSVQPEIHSKGHVYVAEDVLRRQILVLAQRMVAVQTVIEDIVGEPCSLASLFESATLRLRKGRTGSFRVHRLSAEQLPAFLDERRQRFSRVVIATRNLDHWQLVDA